MAIIESAFSHWVAEEAPEELLAALTEFLMPCRDGADAKVAALERATWT
jgi:hypothetical protein